MRACEYALVVLVSLGLGDATAQPQSVEGGAAPHVAAAKAAVVRTPVRGASTGTCASARAATRRPAASAAPARAVVRGACQGL